VARDQCLTETCALIWGPSRTHHEEVFVRGVTEELLWMISGSTDAGALAWG
jgi:hypothetical protein